jgi:uracil-DNA glycosylase family 4
VSDNPVPESPVPPGTGWPGDPATPETPVAAGPAQVRALAASAGSLAELTARESVCRACPRLVAWREEVARVKRRAHATEPYWGRPIAGWGSDQPRILILGLAPAAHGGNRTGRIFTGDRSGDVLFASLHRCGLAAEPFSTAAGDGQRLLHTRMAAAVRCAPPGNKPETAEEAACRPFLAARIAALPRLKVIVTLGDVARRNVLRALGLKANAGGAGHGAQIKASPYALINSYHCSRLNTNTGRLTAAMFEAVFEEARRLLGKPG